MTRRRLLVAALALAALAGLARAGSTAAPARHLVLISIDALRPEFYLDEAFPAPALRSLVRAGSHARAVVPVFPSVTYPGHGAIVTGTRPAKHGVLFNVIWSPAGGRSRWYELATDLRVPALWDAARAAGLTTAAVSWPSTLGASIDWVLPERDYYQRPEPLVVLRQAVTPGLLEGLRITPQAAMFKDVAQWDDFLASVAAAIIRTHRPHLLLLHLVEADSVQHRKGRDAPEVKGAVGRVDGHVGALMKALRDAGIADQTAVIVTGDHGFQDAGRTVEVNEILARAGFGGCPWVGADWRATAHATGGSAGVFLRDGADAAAAEAVLRREAQGRYTVIPRRELDELGAMTGAAFAVEAAPGYAIGGSCGRGVETSSRAGVHGYLPSRPSMSTGFVAAGAGVRAGVVMERIGLVDVAPTAGRLLGVSMAGTDGRALDEILKR